MTNTKHTKDQYDKHPGLYHAGISKDNKWYELEKPVISKFLRDEIKGKNVLDLGCGSGVFIKKLQAMGARKITGLDLSKGLIEIAKKENPGIEFYVGDAKKTPFKNNEFDIVSSSLVPHYFKDLKPLYKEVNRILKKEGLYVFSMHHPVMECTSRLEIKGKKNKIVKFTDYFNNNLYRWKLREKMDMIAYHHTFENIFNSLNKVGFIIEDLAEPKASAKMKKTDRKFYNRTNQRPSFLIIKARKVR